MQTIEPPTRTEIEALPPLLEAEIPLETATPTTTQWQWQEVQASLQSQIQQWQQQVQPTLEQSQRLGSQVLAVLTSKTAINIYRRALIVVAMSITVMLVVALYLGIACYLAGAAVRTLLAQRDDADDSAIAFLSNALEAVARLPLTTQETAATMIDRAEVAINQSRTLLVPMQEFAQKVADLYQAQASSTLEPPAVSPTELTTDQSEPGVIEDVNPIADDIKNDATEDNGNSPDLEPSDTAIASSSASSQLNRPERSGAIATINGSYLG